MHTPSKQEKVPAAETTPKRQDKPVQELLDHITDANFAKVNRLAVRTAVEENHRVSG
jgi:hypothetical protein